MTYQNGPSLRDSQKQALYGTILGGSSIICPDKGKNCYLAMRGQDENWLAYKIDTLKEFFKVDSQTIKKDKNTFRCYSIAYPVFNDIYDTFYVDNQKIVTKEILDCLTDEAWMFWFVDAGRKSARKIYLRTHKFGLEGTQIIIDYFNSLNCECDLHQCRSRYEVIFTNKGAYEFLKIIAPKLPNFLAEKI
jgi:hypothetical protein